MGFSARFTLGLAARLVLLFGAVALFAMSMMTPGLGAARLLAGLLVAGAGWLIWYHVGRTNREIARFVEAIRFGDMTARFGRGGVGGGFDELGAALESGMARMREERAQHVDAQRFYEALVDDAPAAILTIDAEGRVTPINKSARRLFPVSAGVRAADYAPFGADFVAYLADRDPTRRRLVQLTLPNGPQHAIARSAAIQRLGGLTRVVVVQPIQDALNAVEVAAQSDLIRVLTHEIMNSMTPITSLARTAAGLMSDIDDRGDPAIRDAREAVETLSRRADGVMHFVESYRQVSRAPQIRRRRFAAAPFVHELERLFLADWSREHARLQVTVVPDDLTIDADPDLLAQVIINLLRNGAEAASAQGEFAMLSLDLASIKGGARIEISDNGPGVPAAIRPDIFLPFFTTKAKGTGVGLSFARQVVLAHDGTIQIDDAPGGGARFSIVI